MMALILDYFHAVRPALGSALLLVGAVLAIIGTIGVLRFPDFYTRLHAASVTDTAAATLALVGMALLAPSLAVVFKLAVVWLFLFLTGPTSSHALANAAHTAGLQPMIGRLGESEGGAK
ncbi:MAG: monovalent cation/H(+) antiporter subunit G [Pseudomonadota bacterium]